MNITVGTKVRMIKNSGVNKIGELGEVTYVVLRDFRVKTKSSYDDRGNWCVEDDIEIINEQKQTKTAGMTIHMQIAKELDIEIGSRVKITHKVPSNNLGWNNVWDHSMDECVGKECIVRDINTDRGICLAGSWYFPAQVIEVIEKTPLKMRVVSISSDYDAKIYPGDRIEVGCQTISKKTFEKIIEEFNKYKKL